MKLETFNLIFTFNRVNSIPFPPVEVVDNPFLSYKGCFVSARRRTGIPVFFSLSNSWVRFSKNKKSLKIPKSSVTDLTDKFVLGKNQIPNECTEQVFILALPYDVSHSKLPCHVTILSIYMDRTVNVRPVKHRT